MSGPMLSEKAIELAKELAKSLRKALGPRPLIEEQSYSELEKKADILEKFKASDGWLGKFKHRHSIVFKGNQGEAAEIDMQALGNWQQEVLHKAISHFSADDVFNADETGLLWQLLPNTTLAFKGERCTSGKKSKERITVLVGSNMSGTEKLPLLVIGRSAKPRCFKGKEPPVEYKANKKAWMTADIFETWLKNWDRKLKREGRNVLLVLDNFSGHSKIDLEQITVMFLPPNTTARSQPCDQGIIQNIKVHYRRFLLREQIDAIDNKTDFKPNLLIALQFLHRSWMNVKPMTLANCFRKSWLCQECGEEIDELIECEVEPMEGKADYDELSALWAELEGMNLVEGILDDYLVMDDQLATGGTLTLAEIAAEFSLTEVEETEVDSESEVMEIEQEEPELQPVTTRDAREALKILNRCYYSNPAMLELCNKMDELMAEERLKNLKQKNIRDFFAVNH